MPTPHDWTLTDRRFLRSLRIVADAPAPPSPRFVVEPWMNPGEFVLVDRVGLGRSAGAMTVFTPSSFKDPRAAAEDVARQMNEKHKAPTEDGA